MKNELKNQGNTPSESPDQKSSHKGAVGAITRLNMLILMEHDLDAAVAFYQSFGLKLVFRMKDQWAEFGLSNGVKLGLCPTQDPPIDRRTGFVFEVEDVRAACENLRTSDALINEPIEKVHGIMASVKDPGGNIVDLYQPTPERLRELVQQSATQDACCMKKEAEPEPDPGKGCPCG